MTENPGIHVLTDARWAELEPLIDEVRPHGKVPHDNLRETIEAILWRHQNGAKWRSIPGALGPWWKAAQTFIRWAHPAARGAPLLPCLSPVQPRRWENPQPVLPCPKTMIVFGQLKGPQRSRVLVRV